MLGLEVITMQKAVMLPKPKKNCCIIWNAEFIRLDRQIDLASSEYIAAHN
jgi:hypothetical protein